MRHRSQVSHRAHATGFGFFDLGRQVAQIRLAFLFHSVLPNASHSLLRCGFSHLMQALFAVASHSCVVCVEDFFFTRLRTASGTGTCVLLGLCCRLVHVCALLYDQSTLQILWKWSCPAEPHVWEYVWLWLWQPTSVGIFVKSFVQVLYSSEHYTGIKPKIREAYQHCSQPSTTAHGPHLPTLSLLIRVFTRIWPCCSQRQPRRRVPSQGSGLVSEDKQENGGLRCHDSATNEMAMSTLIAILIGCGLFHAN